MAAAIPGLIMLGVGLIGSWLLGPKSSTSNPDAMPQLNNALRGKVMPVTFGTNRVYGEIGWTKNFKAVRQKSSGKGGAKGGGSGGFGAAKGGGSAGQGYEYFWDMIFNFGIMDQPSVIRRGWVGGDPLDDISLNNITAARTGFIQSIIPLLHQADQTEKPAKLHFTEAFYAPGYTTGDTNLESWAYFATQEGVQCQWPNTAWIGFNALDLGQSPAVPQLSYEFVPATGDFTLMDEYTAKINATGAGGSTFVAPHTNEGYCKGVDNNHYYVNLTDVHAVKVIRAEDTVVLTRTETQFRNDLTAAGFVGANFSLAPGNSVVVGAPNSPYVWAWSYHATAHVTYEVAGICYKISSTGTLVVNGSMGGETADLGWLLGQNDVMSVLNHADQLNVLVQNNDNKIGIVTLGLGSDSVLTGIGSFDSHFTEVRNEWGVNFSDFKGQNRNGNTVMTLVPIDANQVHILTYIGAAESDYTLAHTGVNTVWDLDIAGPCILYGDGTIHNVTSLFGITDIKTHADGSASSSYYDDYVSPNSVFLGDQCYLLFLRSYTTDFGTKGTLARVRSFTFTGTAAVAKQDLSGAVFDVASAGVAQGAYPEMVQACLDPSEGFIRALWYGHNNPLSGYFVSGIYGTLATAQDVTPPYIIKRILTSSIFGFQTEALFGYTVTADRIDSTSYDAAVQYCVDQGIYISVTYTSASNLLDVLNELVALYGGFLRDPSGIIQFGVVTGSDAPIRTIDNAHLIPSQPGKPPVQVTKGALEDGYNKVQFNYLDRAISYNQNQVEAADEVDMDFNGPRVKTYEAKFVMTGSTASNIAARALWANLYGKDTYSFKLGWKDADLCQGDLITLVDSFDNLLRGGVRARITNWKNPSRGMYDVTAVREFPNQIQHQQGYTQTTSMTGGFGTLVQSVEPNYANRAYELPREFQDSNGELYFGYNPSFFNMGAQLYISHDGTNYVLTQDAQPHIVAGALNEALPSRLQGYVEQDIDFYIFPTSPFDTSSPTFVQTYELDNVTQALRAAGAGVLIVGSEAISIQDLTLLGQNHYRAKYMFRGWGGTPIDGHSSGDLFHEHAAGIFMHQISENEIGTNISYKIAPYNFAGVVQDISSIDAQSYTIRGVYWLPRAQPRTSIWVDSAQAWPASVPITGPYIGVFSGDGVIPAGSSITLTWPQASNIDGFGAGGFGANGYGHFISDVFSTSYRVDVYSANAHAVGSYVVGTGYFRYTAALNSADFGGFARNLIFKITPNNAKGDGPVADVRSLSMNW